MTASTDLHADTPGPSCVLDGKYRLDEGLGEGAVGLVYRATVWTARRRSGSGRSITSSNAF
jgi:hypothetical protein